MNKDERYRLVIDWFKENMPDVKTELNYTNAYELLVAVILSAQCTDKRINKITPKLFHDFPTIESLAQAEPDVIFEYVRSATYPNSKAKHLVGMAQMLLDKYMGVIPEETKLLMKLPGVGRKTANVITSIIYGQPTMAVDTHVFRVSNRIGLTTHSKTPLATENELTKRIPKKLLSIAHHWLILHGRYICQARKPKCDLCGLQLLCKDYISKHNVAFQETKADE